MRRGHLATDPTADEDLAVRQRGQRLPASFTDDEMARIIAAAAREDPGQRPPLRWPIRDLATVALLAGCGLRASELCALTWERVIELDRDLPRLRVIGKGPENGSYPCPPPSR